MKLIIDHMSIVQRVYPSSEQFSVLWMHCAHARFVYNLGLEQYRQLDRQTKARGHRVTFLTQSAELTALRAEVNWLRAGSSSVQRQALRDLHTALKNFYDSRTGKRAGKSVGFPVKKKRHAKQSFYIRDLVVQRLSRKWAMIAVPKLGMVKFRLTRAWEEIRVAKSARFSYAHNQWHVSFTTLGKKKIVPETDTVVGVDRGVTHTIATDDGDFSLIPNLSETEKQRFLCLERKLAKTVKGSNRRRNVLKKLSTLRRRLKNRRKEWIEQTTTRLATKYSVSVLEKLETANMVRRAKPKPDPTTPGKYLPNNASAKSGLNRAILASCWAEFAARLEHKTIVEYVNPKFSSLECHACGHTAPENRESQAVFVCKKCGHENHADTNAALNIKERYLNVKHPGTQGKRAPNNANHHMRA